LPNGGSSKRTPADETMPAMANIPKKLPFARFQRCVNLYDPDNIAPELTTTLARTADPCKIRPLFTPLGSATMSRICQVTGKKPMYGHNVSHANNKTKRRFLPNLHVRRFWVESESRWVRLRVSSNGLRIIDKNGIDTVLADIRSRGTKV